MKRTQNVIKSKYFSKRVTYKGINFHSKLEASFYTPILNFATKNNLKLELQKKFKTHEILGKSYYYIADFYLENEDGLAVFIDSKGYNIAVSLTKIKIVSALYNMPYYVGSSIVEAIRFLKNAFKL